MRTTDPGRAPRESIDFINNYFDLSCDDFFAFFTRRVWVGFSATPSQSLRGTCESPPWRLGGPLGRGVCYIFLPNYFLNIFKELLFWKMPNCEKLTKITQTLWTPLAMLHPGNSSPDDDAGYNMFVPNPIGTTETSLLWNLTLYCVAKGDYISSQNISTKSCNPPPKPPFLPPLSSTLMGVMRKIDALMIRL